MKRLFLSLFCLLAIGLSASAQQIMDVVYYDSNSSEPFVYNHDFSLEVSGYSGIDFNLPIASSFSINGLHLQFTIENEDFKWYIVRKHPEKYYDFIPSFIFSISSQTVPFIIRVYFD
ncbi:MAG: hypothetical protein ACI4AH_00220 [Muribaculaceae bacterium]